MVSYTAKPIETYFDALESLEMSPEQLEEAKAWIEGIDAEGFTLGVTPKIWIKYAQRVLGALIGSELTFIQAVLYRPQDAEQATADAMDDRRVWLLAFERLCRLAGLPEDPLDV